MTNSSAIAIIGMSGRFPGANTVAEFWKNLCEGKETIKRFDHAELSEAGLPQDLLQNSLFVPARGILEKIDCFDAAFFSYTPREAELLDPQQRIFLECAWSAIEDAGYNPLQQLPHTGVFAGCNQNTYQLFHVIDSEETLSKIHGLVIYSDKDFLATRVSHKLNLQGPSYTLQSACSTSLVAIHAACQSLLALECDMALAGGVSVVFPQVGYMYQPGGVFSPDGHCRAFDQKAEGTLGGDGVGIVVLKRMEDALKDNDNIYAIILGTAINNDGSHKASYAAPSVEGQMRVIQETLEVADVDPTTIQYIETHGTGTPIGDLVEITALQRIFEAHHVGIGACKIGSLKPNIGHLDQAAGVANIIKAALSVKHGIIPPSLYCESPHPELNFDSSPFEINTQLSEWPVKKFPRRAGVSSFGFGGTNAHAILEETPVFNKKNRSSTRSSHLLLISARSKKALNSYSEAIKEYLLHQSCESFSDVAYVLKTGRPYFNKRLFLVADSAINAKEILSNKDSKFYLEGDFNPEKTLPLYFLFPGQGAQYIQMGKGLYESEPFFQQEINMAAKLLHNYNIDLLELIFPTGEDVLVNEEKIYQARYSQLILFIFEYALAKLFLYYGVKPKGLLGHSIGEYAAACLAGVFSFEDALQLVLCRGELVQQLPSGVMLSIEIAVDEMTSHFLVKEEKISLAAINTPKHCVVAGEEKYILLLEGELQQRKINHQRLRVSYAFHSPMLEPILASFHQTVSSLTKSAFNIPFISSVTGDWITQAQATSSTYWVEHLRQSVLFSKGSGVLLRDGPGLFLEVGPGKILGSLIKQSPDFSSHHIVLNSVRPAKRNESDIKIFLIVLGNLWLNGVDINWKNYYAHENRQRISLPTYPFERTRYFLSPKKLDGVSANKTKKSYRLPLQHWLYAPTWTRMPLYKNDATRNTDSCFFAVSTELDFVQLLKTTVEKNNMRFYGAILSEDSIEKMDNIFQINYTLQKGFDKMIEYFNENNQHPDKILYAISLSKKKYTVTPQENLKVFLGFIQLLIKINTLKPLQLLITTTGSRDVLGTEELNEIYYPLLGIVRVVSQEYPHLNCRIVDFEVSIPFQYYMNDLIEEWMSWADEKIVAYRGKSRFCERFESCMIKNQKTHEFIKMGSVILITGGLGEVGLILASYLVKKYQARLILVGRSSVPEKTEWDKYVKFKSLKNMLDEGATILFEQADVSDRDQMHRVFSNAMHQFGKIDGIIHAAGVSGSQIFKGLKDTREEDIDLHFKAKVEGVKMIKSLLDEMKIPVQFCILQSSLFGIVGGPGTGIYSAATSFMDSFALSQARGGNINPRWISINWDAWLPAHFTSNGLSDLAMTPEEIHQVFECILASWQQGNIVVSIFDLHEKIEKWSENHINESDYSDNQIKNQYDRPELSTRYIAPDSDIEIIVAKLWEKTLGINHIGVSDDFFELGGDSLSAMQLTAYIKEKFPIELQIIDLIENPTVTKLGCVIETELFKKLDGMSEEEVTAILNSTH
jgi:acyl transferase domain-containing protein/acyl carrier protein